MSGQELLVVTDQELGDEAEEQAAPQDWSIRNRRIGDAVWMLCILIAVSPALWLMGWALLTLL